MVINVNLKIIKECSWRKVYINILDENYNLIHTEKLSFKDSICSYNFNLENSKFYYLSNGKEYKTEVVIISKNTEIITLKYNSKTKKYYIYLSDTVGLYDNCETYILRDEKNLYFRPDKAKKIDIIVPKNYDEKKKYPLLIMFDGQNLFDLNNVGNYTTKNDPYGSWQVDVSMSMLSKNKNLEFIVVGIEHTDILRTNELLTDTNKFHLKSTDLLEEHERVGLIDHLDDFINETLLPFITNKYSIDLENIGISGSSMGGMGCHYIGLKNLGKYKFILSFTPASALVVDSDWCNFYQELNFKENIDKLPLFYFFQGNNGELENMLYEGNLKLINNLLKYNYPPHLIKSYIELSAEHNEVAWRYAFNHMIYNTFE